MFNFFKFKTEEEFVTSLSSVKEKLKEEIIEEMKIEISENLSHQTSIEIINSRERMRYNDTYLTNLIMGQVTRIDKIQLTQEKLQTQIETLLNVLRVNAKIED